MKNTEEFKAARREYMKAWRISNPEAARRNDKNNRERHPERVAKNKRDAYDRDTERYKLRARLHYQSTTPEKRKISRKKWRDENPDKVKAIAKKSRETNRARIAAASRFRQLKLKNRTPVWADQYKIKEYYMSAERLTKETGIKHSVDHIIPISHDLVSGLHCEFNLQVIPLSENVIKSNRIDLFNSSWVKNEP